MASANQTLSESGSEFEADNTERTATLQVPGGRVHNTGSANAAFINVDAGTVDVSRPCAASSREVPVGGVVILPRTCRAFTFRSPSGTNLLYESA